MSWKPEVSFVYGILAESHVPIVFQLLSDKLLSFVYQKIRSSYHKKLLTAYERN